MTWQDHAVQFDCGEQQLTGIATLPQSAKDVGVLVIVGGPQYRVGSHRQFVLLTRFLASQGFAAMRFDYRGMGDSLGTMGHFEQVCPDVSAAIAAFQQAAPQVRRVVLWGLCDGASAALLYLHDRKDPRVAGLVLLNPWIRTVASQARTRLRHYYWQRVVQRDFWVKLLVGKVAKHALRDLFSNLFASRRTTGSADGSGKLAYPDRMAQAWVDFTGPTLLMLSEQDYTAREFESYCSNDPGWRRALRTHPPVRVALSQADHTCSQPQAEAEMHRETVRFLSSLGPD
jgi:exosortase A-associated hydrolase 1